MVYAPVNLFLDHPWNAYPLSNEVWFRNVGLALAEEVVDEAVVDVVGVVGVGEGLRKCISLRVVGLR